MSTKGNLTRDQAVALVGEAAIARLERQNCEPTGRVGYNGACQGDTLTEWASGLRTTDVDGLEVSVRAYYYTTPEQDQTMADCDGDGSAITWAVSGYEIE